MTQNSLNKVSTHPLQTWEWGEFRKKWGNEVVRFDFGQITLHKIPFTSYKVGNFSKGGKPTKTMLEELKDFAKKNKVIFIKMEPNVLNNSKDIALLKSVGALPGKTLFTPTTFWIDLSKTEAELLASFHSKTRYNIRLAIKKGVDVREDNSKEAFEKYLMLTKETSQRQKFFAHSEKYHRLMWKHLHTDLVNEKKAPIARLLTARFEGEIITTWILFIWKDFLYYPYGASTDKHKNVMANNLMMWEAINLGKRLRLTTFDLWGREPGKGFTPFKEGYNPKVVEFLGTWDLVCSPLYFLYTKAELARWMALRLKSKLTKPSF